MLEYGYKGKIFPINPRANEILGIKAYAALKTVNEPIDLAVIAVHTPDVLETIKQCGEKAIKSAIVISAGFKEASSEGARLEQELKK